MNSLKSTSLWAVSDVNGLLLSLVLALALSSANVLAADVVTDRGFAHTTIDADLVATAIDNANLLLVDDGRRLFPAWKHAPDQREATPVYLVATKKDALTTPAAVPSDCTCIFVNPLALQQWIGAQTKGTGRLPIDRGNILVYMLLHESGHLRYGTSGVSFANGSLSTLNVDKTFAKKDEERADDFASNLVRRYLEGKKPSSATLAANWVANELTKLSWNMQAYRTLDEFGAFATGKPSVYFDATYEHPNLAWRILRTNYLIQQTPETRSLLDAFEKARQRGVAQSSRLNGRHSGVGP
jgi:hypothetical protein